jgi:uncharacterized protein YjdB
MTARSFPLPLLAALAAVLVACGGGGGGQGGAVAPTPSPTLERVDVTIGDASLPVGALTRLTATGTYSDGATADLSASVVWSSSSPDVATVSNAAGTAGVATAVAVGTVTLRAQTADGIAGTADLSVVDVPLVLLDVAPVDPAIAAGTVLALTATGTYGDDSVLELTLAVAWTSSDPAVVSVAADGTATLLAPGTATITATDAGTGIQATTAITVLAPDAPVALSYLSLSRGAVLGGGTVTGTVVLTGAAASPVVVALSSSGANATVPATVTVPAGETRATFTVSTTTPARRKVRVTLRATYDGVTKVATLNVRR